MNFLYVELLPHLNFNLFVKEMFFPVFDNKNGIFLTDFENVENEWPIFYIFMIIDGAFKDNQDQVNQYQV